MDAPCRCRRRSRTPSTTPVAVHQEGEDQREMSKLSNHRFAPVDDSGRADIFPPCLAISRASATSDDAESRTVAPSTMRPHLRFGSRRARKFSHKIRTRRHARRAPSVPCNRRDRDRPRERFGTGTGLDPPDTGRHRVGSAEARLNFSRVDDVQFRFRRAAIERAPGSGYGRARPDLVPAIAPHP